MGRLFFVILDLRVIFREVIIGLSTPTKKGVKMNNIISRYRKTIA